MVIRFILILLTLSVPSIASELYRFQAEFSKSEAYVGEEVKCDFVLYTTLSAVEVEVAKFPEFRGYWKENLILRQGKIPIPYARFSGNLWKKVIIGSYRLSPMVGEKKPEIQPMKIVVKNPFSADEPGNEILLSDLKPGIRVRQLPPFSPKADESFDGAVGDFSLYMESNEVPFQQDEPTVVRYSLRGQGNFQEISGAQLQLPEDVKLLSKRTYTQGSSPYQVQNFEWTLSIARSEDLVLPPLRFTYFDPRQQRYQTLEGTPINLRFQASIAEKVEVESPPVVWLSPEPTWSAHVSLAKSYWFWGFHFVVLSSLLGFVLRHTQIQRQRAYEQSFEFQQKRMWQEVQHAFEQKDYERFLQLGEHLVVTILKEKAKISEPGSTRKDVLKVAKDHVSEQLVESALVFFKAHDDFAFSPSRKTPENPQQLFDSLSSLIAA